MVKILTAVLLCIAPVLAANETPRPDKALEEFQAYQRFVGNLTSAQKHRSKIEKALRISPIMTKSEPGRSAPMLTFVLFSRTHFQSSHASYSEVRREIDRLIASADFESHLYQLNDLHPDQARQSIWQLSRYGVSMRVEVVPNNAITITLFSSADFRSALHATRRALIP